MSCRICGKIGSSSYFNIFLDEISITEKKSQKIYIVLNNFLYEKLYSPDDHSSLICQSCCESLFNSYHFMLKVRESEQEHSKEPANKKVKVIEEEVVNEIEEEALIHEEEIISEQQDIIEEDDVTIIEEIQCDDHEVEIISDNTSSTEDTVTFLDYSLEFREEKNQNYVGLRLGTVKVKKSDCKNYTFNIPSHSDSSAIYSCLYCVKAFGSLTFLIKHLATHFCSICLLVIPSSYNDLTKHMKEEHQSDVLNCPFCLKSFKALSIRSHIKKMHKSMPQYMYVKIEKS